DVRRHTATSELVLSGGALDDRELRVRQAAARDARIASPPRRDRAVAHGALFHDALAFAVEAVRQPFTGPGTCLAATRGLRHHEERRQFSMRAGQSSPREAHVRYGRFPHPRKHLNGRCFRGTTVGAQKKSVAVSILPGLVRRLSGTQGAAMKYL